MAGSNTPITSSLSKLQSLHGLFAIYKKPGPTSADVLNTLKEALLRGKEKLVWCFVKSTNEMFSTLCFSEAGVDTTNARKRKKQQLKMGHGGTLDSAASGVLGTNTCFI